MTSIDNDAWIPRDDMAVLARCSAYTIKRDHEKHKLETRTDAAGRVLVNVGDYLRIGRIRPEDLTAGASPAESAEMIRAREVVTDLKTQLAELTGRLGLADMTVETLRDQLATKDKQLAKQADQITQLISRLGTLGGAA